MFCQYFKVYKKKIIDILDKYYAMFACPVTKTIFH